MTESMNETTTDHQSLSIPYSYAKRHGVLLSAIDPHSATITHKPSPNPIILRELRRRLVRPLQLQEVSAETFDNLLAKAYEADSNSAMKAAELMGEELNLDELIQQLPKTQDLLESQDDAPIIRLLNAIFSQAVKREASDIHIETFETRVLVRFRIDGVLQEVLDIQRVLAPLVVSRIKVMAKLDIAEKRLPQDGRISLKVAGHTIDVRVSTLPSNHGERVVMRLLDKKVSRLNLSHLGMSTHSLSAVKNLLAKPNGIILVTGPTGAGKTTSLYAMLSQLNDVQRNILTVEDPIEYDLPGIGQTQVNTKIDMTFAKGLRAILRQDPDVVMVGEIRDLATAEIAIQASLTGHLVLSTLHTNSAIGAVTRLGDMGVEPFLLATSLIGVIAQRLVRLLCPHCKRAHQADASELALLKKDKTDAITIYQATGCEQCNNTGFKGRTGIYEVVSIDNKMEQMIHSQQSEAEIEAYARKTIPSMRQDGMARVLNGETTIEEVLRVTVED